MESNEYKLISQQLTSISSMMTNQFSGINQRLDKINGKVDKHETEITGALSERSANRQKQNDYFSRIETIENKIDTIEKMEITHVLNCPVNPKLRVLEDKLLSQESIKKYMSKIFIIGISLGALMVGIIEVIISINK